MDRVAQEDRWWIVCGLEGLWELEEADGETIRQREQMALEAVKEHGLTMQNLMDWAKYQDDVEWRSADAVAWMGMRLLEEKLGKEVVVKFAKRSVTRRVNREDGRAVAWDFMNSVTAAFKKTTGQELEEFTDQWREFILSFEKETEAEAI